MKVSKRVKEECARELIGEIVTYEVIVDSTIGAQSKTMNRVDDIYHAMCCLALDHYADTTHMYAHAKRHRWQGYLRHR